MRNDKREFYEEANSETPVESKISLWKLDRWSEHGGWIKIKIPLNRDDWNYMN